MAAKKHYAWGPINLDGKVIEAGSVVTEKQIGDDWDALVESKAIRTKIYPNMPKTWQGSVRGFRMEQVRAIRAGLDARDLLAQDGDDTVEDEEENEFLELLAEVESGDNG